MEHNDTDKDLPEDPDATEKAMAEAAFDPDATECVPVDVEALLHMELDAALVSARESAKQAVAKQAAKPSVAKPSVANLSVANLSVANPSVPKQAARRPSLPRTVRAMRVAPEISASLLAAAKAESIRAQKAASRSSMPAASYSSMPAASRSSMPAASYSSMPAASRPSIPVSQSPIPRPPIHTLPPPRPSQAELGRMGELESGEAATCVFDRASGRESLPSIKPSVRSVAFPAPDFSAPRIPQPFATVPSMPAAKRARGAQPAASALESQGITPIQPVLAPTSRRDLRLASAFESLAPMAMSAYSSAPPPPSAASRGSTLALVLTMVFTFASAAVMGVGAFKPTALQRGKTALVHAFEKKTKAAPIAAKPAEPVALPEASAASAAPVAVPPVLIDGVPADLGAKDTALYLPDAAKGHRVFVDGIPHDETDRPYLVVACGKHKIQIGSTGKEKPLDLPCGGAFRTE